LGDTDYFSYVKHKRSGETRKDKWNVIHNERV
jgi:hypothetical protein